MPDKDTNRRSAPKVPDHREKMARPPKPMQPPPPSDDTPDPKLPTSRTFGAPTTKTSRPNKPKK